MPAPADVPVDPDAPTARRWAVEELADPVYHRGRSLLARLWEWIVAQFDGMPSLGLPSPWVLAIVVVVVLLVVGVAFRVTGAVHRTRRLAAAGAVLDPDDRRSADQLRASAEAAARAGRWPDAVADRFRAVVRSLEERTVLDERAGRTADEAARAAARRLGALTDELAEGAQLFDAVVYGRARADAADDERMRRLDARVAASRPSVAAPVAP